MNKNFVFFFNSNKKLLHVYICCARPNGRTVRHISNKIVYYNYQTINISVYILHINFYLNMTSDFIFVCLCFSIKMTCFTNRSSRDVDPASSEFSINSLTTLNTEVITWELPNNLTVSFGNSWSDRCWTAISKVEKGALCKPKVEQSRSNYPKKYYRIFVYFSSCWLI